MTSYLITGANRGLGLALVANLSSQPNSLVFAAARKSSPELKKLVDDADGRIAPVDVEVTKPVSIAAAVEVVQKHLGDRGLDILINNAGMSSFSAGGTPAMEDLGDVLDVNVVSVQRMTKAFLPLLRQGSEKKVVNMQVTSPIYMPDLTDRSHSTSTLGSIAMAPFFSFAPAPAYKISKAALNMLTVQYAQDLGKEGFIFLPISPGVGLSLFSWMQEDR